ncbi:MAG: ABC transporter permease [Bacilli bacterium]
MKLAFSIAVRFLKSGKLQTLFIILGIAVGVSVQVFIGSLISGLQKSLVDKTIGNSSQITISAPVTEYITQYDQIIADIENADGIKAVSPALSINGFAINGTNTAPLLLRGFDSSNNYLLPNTIYRFNEKLIEGRMPSSDDEIILGKDLKGLLNISLEEQIMVDIPQVDSQNVKVVGFFDFGVAAVNAGWGMTSLTMVQTLLNVPNQVNAIEMQIDDDRIFDAVSIAEAIAPSVPDNLKLTNWIDNNQELLSGLQGQSISSTMIQVFVMISVVLGIASVLAIIVLQKSKQIGILKAMGIQNGDASFIFLFEGLILGLLGAIFGVMLGLGLSYSFVTFALKPDGTPVVPLYIDGQFIAVSAAIAVLAALGASIIPARKSSKLSVIEVIRNG